LKICDFGLARSIKEEMELSEYVVTRHYRAPEVMTNAKKYDAQIDVWSVGCIFAELLGRKALFPGSDYLEQLRLIISKVGSPAKEDLDLIPTPAARSYIEGLGVQKKMSYASVFPHATPQALDLLDQMLQFNAKKRITVDDALRHEYFKGLHREQSITQCKSVFKWDWEKTELDEARIQDLMWEEIYHFRPHIQEDREKRLQDGSIPDFKTIKAQMAAHGGGKNRRSSKEKEGKEKSDRGRDTGGGTKKEDVISVPVPDPEIEKENSKETSKENSKK